MTSTLTLYKDSKILPHKLFVVDSLSTYLSTLTKEVINNFQYVRQALRVYIKINASQTNLDFINDNDYNYCSIQNGSEKVCYYFITGKTQIAQNTIELTLEMDTINTFTFNEDFVLSPRTRINRQHKDRFKIVAGFSAIRKYYVDGPSETRYISAILASTTEIFIDESLIGFTISNFDVKVISNPNVGLAGAPTLSGDTLSLTFRSSSPESFSYEVEITLTGADRTLRKIDRQSEGLSPILYGNNLGNLIDDNAEEDNYYLIYKGTSTIECLLASDKSHTYVVGGKTKYVPSDFTTNKLYYFMMDARSTSETYYKAFFYPDTGVFTFPLAIVGMYQPTRTISGNRRVSVIIRSDGTHLYYRVMAHERIQAGWVHDFTSDEIRFPHDYFYISSSLTALDAHILDSYTDNLTAIYGATAQSFQLTAATYTTNPFSSLDRQDSTLVKIIKLPYPPINESDVGTMWTYNNDTGFLQYTNIDMKLSQDFIVSNSISRNPLGDLLVDLSSVTPYTLRNAQYESKLYHSDYYQIKFIYDAFSKMFALERINLDKYELFIGTPFTFNFTASNTVSSKFLFTFSQYNTEGYQLEDYDNICAVDRNNEMVIYNSDYMNYIKSGFNYDIKKKNRQEAGNWIGTGLSLVGAIASFASSAVTGGAGIATGIAFATSSLAQLTRSINATAQAEATQQEKLAQLRMQKESVYNTDAVDLLDVYSNNKAKLMVYKTSEILTKQLFDLFFYTGYIDGTMGIPDVTTRTRFNFVSLDIVMDAENNIPSEILDDIIEKYNIGVTFLHYYNSEWDWTQKYENWETSLEIS